MGFEMKDYESEFCQIDSVCDLTPEEGEKMVGKTIYKIHAGEYELLITFDDGSELKLSGGRWDGSLGMEYMDDG